MLQPPALIVMFFLASVLAVLLHLGLGRSLRDLLLFWLASCAGCICGQLLGGELHLIPWMVGQVHIAEAAVLAVLFVLVTAWLRPRGKKA